MESKLIDNLDPNKELLELEQEINAFPQIDCPIRDRFVNGLYFRECTIPAGVMAISETHLTEHPYVVSKGKISVYTEENGWILIEAPFTGITKPGTKRLVYAHEETIWTTFHATDKTTREEVENEILKRKE